MNKGWDNLEVSTIQNLNIPFAGADPVQGALVTAHSTPDMGVHVAAGKYQNVPIQATDLVIEQPGPVHHMENTNADITGGYSITNTEYPAVSLGGFNINNIVVKDHTTHETLNPDTDYTVTVYPSGNYSASLISISGTLIVDISFDIPVIRADMVVVNKTTGIISIVKGNETTWDPWTSLISVPEGYHRLANIYVSANVTSIPNSNIFNVQNYVEGLTQQELFFMDLEKYQNAIKLSRFYTAIESAQATGQPVNIGIMGDSVVDGTQPHMGEGAANRAWLAIFIDSLNVVYPDAGINWYSVQVDGECNLMKSWAAKNGFKLIFNIYNYAQGGHNIFQFMEDGDGHYDKNEANKYSCLYSNCLNSDMDLFLVGRTNSCPYLQDLRHRADLTGYTSTFGSTGKYLYDIMTAAPYNLTLHPQTDYEDATNGQNWLTEDNLKCYNACLQRIYTDMSIKRTTGNPGVFGADVVFVSGTPDHIDYDGCGRYSSSVTVTSQRYQDVIKSQFAMKNNCVYINLWDIINTLDTRLGIPKGSAAYFPDQVVHPNRCIHALFGKIISKLICPGF